MIAITEKDKNTLLDILKDIKETGNDDSIQNIQKMIRVELEARDIDLSDPTYVESIERDFITPMLKELISEKEALRKRALDILIKSGASKRQIDSGITDGVSMKPADRKEYNKIISRRIEIKIDTYPITYLGYELKKVKRKLEVNLVA